MNDKTEYLDFAAVKEFFRDRENIASAFIFGSAQSGEVKQGSDVDVAVLFNTLPEVKEKFDFYSDLCDVLNLNKTIDLVVLNGAEPILAFEGISGTRVSNNNPQKTAAFSSYTSRLYEETMSSIEYQYSLRR